MNAKFLIVVVTWRGKCGCAQLDVYLNVQDKNLFKKLRNIQKQCHALLCTFLYLKFSQSLKRR